MDLHEWIYIDERVAKGNSRVIPALLRQHLKVCLQVIPLQLCSRNPDIGISGVAYSRFGNVRSRFLERAGEDKPEAWWSCPGVRFFRSFVLAFEMWAATKDYQEFA